MFREVSVISPMLQGQIQTRKVGFAKKIPNNLSGLTFDRVPVRGGLERWEFDGTIGTWHHKQQKWCASVVGIEEDLGWLEADTVFPGW